MRDMIEAFEDALSGFRFGSRSPPDPHSTATDIR
jgi:hypothetical protein